MKQIIITLFILLNLNGFSQITFTGVKKSSNITDNESKKDVAKKELNTSNLNVEEKEPQKVSTTIRQNRESSTYNESGKVNVKIYNPEAEEKSAFEQRKNTIQYNIEPVEDDIRANKTLDTIQKNTEPVNNIFIQKTTEETANKTNTSIEKTKPNEVIVSDIVGKEQFPVVEGTPINTNAKDDNDVDFTIGETESFTIEELESIVNDTNLDTKTKATTKTIEEPKAIINTGRVEPKTIVSQKAVISEDVDFTIEETESVTIEELESIVNDTDINNETVVPSEIIEEPKEVVIEQKTVINTEIQEVVEPKNTSNQNAVISTNTKEAIEIEEPKRTSGIFFGNSPKTVTTKTIEEPIVNETIEEPKVETPTIEEPIIQKSIVEETVIEEQVIEKPVTETPVAKVPVTETPAPTYNTTNTQNVATTNTVENKEDKPTNPKKGSWSIGIGAGLPIVIGDMSTRFGYGASLTVQKAMGHVFSLRFQAIALETFGRDNELNNNTYSNYKTRFSDYTLQGVFTLNNLNFYKKEPKVIYNLIAGGGLATRHSWMDLYDENASLYSYDGIPRGDVSETTTALNELLDKNYETIVAKDEETMSIKNTSILPSLVLGAGISVKLSKVIDLNLETRMSYHFDDHLDAQERGTAKDWMSFTTLGLTFKIPSKTESMLWTNPIYSKVEEIEDLKKKVDEGDLLKDEDKDGIADIFDQDLNTPPKVAVDSRGVAADMDRDGVPDYQDAEPFTTIGAQVNKNGVAIDSDNDGIADIIDQEPNSLPGKQVDANGKTINTANDLANLENNSDFDLIFFEENSHKIQKEFYSTLYKISKYITRDPSAKIEIIGHTDVLASEKYNLDLSEKRANAVYSILIELFKVPNKNLVTKYLGEKEPIIEGLPEIKESNLAPAYYLNRRVEFKILK